MRDVLIATPMGIERRAVRRSVLSAAVHVTGVGTARAHAAAEKLAAAPSAPVAIAGFAGGLRADQRPGQVVVATEVRIANGARTGLPIPGAEALAAQLRRGGLDVVAGPIVSSRSPAWGRRRAELAASGALAVDMESAWLAGPLLARDPHRVAVVRVLVDTPDHEIYSPTLMRAALPAYRALSRVAPAIEAWAAAVGPRRVVLARPRSFCAGVERAIATVRRALELYGSPVYVRRQIVHNTHVVDELRAAGAVFVDDLDEVPRGAVAVIAAHGVAPAVREQGAQRSLRMIDATCPLVAKVHNEARARVRDGYSIVLIGHADHEEIEGTRGEAPEAIHVISDVDDVDTLDLSQPGRVAYLTQTTLALDETAAVVDRLRQRFPGIVAPRADDICYATQNRQHAVRALAGACDLMIVVGSRNSSNSTRLAEVASRAGVDAHLVDDETALDLSWLARARTIGVTAGASAPDHLVRRVVDRLSCLGPVEVVDQDGSDEDIRFPLPAEVR